MTTKQNQEKNIEELKIFLNASIFTSLIKLITRLSKEINIKVDDFLSIFGVNIKNNHSDIKKQELHKVINMILGLFKSDINFDLKVDLCKILSSSLDLDIKYTLNKDNEFLLDYFTKLILSPQLQWEYTFVYHEASRPVHTIHKYILFYNNRELDEVEKAENILTKEYFNLYDINFFENNILNPLRQSGVSQEWLDNAELIDIFTKYISTTNKKLIECANNWYTSKLRDIEQEVNEKIKDTKGNLIERDSESKKILRHKLYRKHFKEKK